MLHDQTLKKLNYDFLTLSPRVVREGESAGETFATILVYFEISDNLICNMTTF